LSLSHDLWWEGECRECSSTTNSVWHGRVPGTRGCNSP
jgi:hypothetical protein